MINLGEDPAAVVLGNDPCLRMQVAPGEGLRVPAGMPLTSDGREQEQPDVWLVIRFPEPTV